MSATGCVERDLPLSFLACFPNPIWRAGLDGRLDWFNPAWLTLTGRVLDQEAGEGWLGGVHPNDRERCQADLRKHFAARTPFELTCRIRNEEDSFHTLRMRVAPFFGLSGECIGFIGSCEDIDGQKNLAVDRQAIMARVAQRHKFETMGQLTGGITHAFNNMLAAMMGYIDLALMRYGHSDPALARYLEQSHSAGMRARDLAARLLAFGRPGTSAQIGALDEGGINDCLEILRHALPESITFNVSIDPNTPAPAIAAGEINEVLMNLVLNARDALRTGGKVTVSVGRKRLGEGGLRCASCHGEVRGDFFALGVADTGHGIEASVLDQLFDPFFTTREPGQGNGLGLAMVHDIIHNHHGHVLLETSAAGGSCFTVLLPVRSGAARHLPAEKVGALVVSGVGKRVLVAEDEDLVRGYLVDVLENEGFYVVDAPSGEAAMALFEADPDSFHLLLTDQVMPGISGIDLTRRLHQLKPDLPVIICSAYSPEDIAPIAAHLGIRDVLSKPLRVSELRTAVVRVLKPGA